MNEIITAAVQVVCFVFVVGAGLYAKAWTSRKLDAAKQEELAYWVDVAVHAAEQMYPTGQEKLEYVKKFLHDYELGDQYGDMAEALIEAAVYALNRGQ